MAIDHCLKPFVVWVTECWQNNFKASSIWRLTGIYTGLLMLVVGILLWVLYQLSVGQLSRSQAQQISQLLQQQTLLAKELQPADFIRQFELQAEQAGQFVLVFISPERSYGRLQSIPSQISACPTLSRFPVYSYNEIRLFSGCVELLNTGRLLVATDDEALVEMRERFIHASMIALALALALGLLTGWWFSAQLLRRINRINQVALAVEQGQLDARVPLSRHHDEFDHLAKHMNKMLAQLEYSFQAIAGVTDAIAHDLRTPLGRLRLALEQSLIDVEHQRLSSTQVSAMLAELDGILVTFSAMLELTRLEQHQQQAQFSAVDLVQIAEDAIELLLPVSQQQDQHLCLFNARAAKPLQGDPSLLFRAIYNLLENASKYAGPQTQISFEFSGDGFIVSDNGPGIPEMESEKVFQRLYRLESSRHSPGYGLGLPLVRAIVALHGGEIKLSDNQPGLRVSVSFSQNEAFV
ncbi:sensor histidine kinase [Agarivorans sp. QJM3NY_29]|uniref:sensor histidine kinase n=1 Tax=unclassified Agarivorans TaxID=2636026 RepID=UPI003D7DD97A